jgi:hypothetical protein
VPVDGVAQHPIGLNTAGDFEFVAEGVNGIVLVQQS